MVVRIPVLHFNDVYRIQQNVKTSNGAKKLSAAQFAANILAARSKWPNVSDTTTAGECLLCLLLGTSAVG